jgi:hypothetical protein
MAWSSASGSTSGQDSAEVVSAGGPPGAGQQVAAHPERGQDRPERVGCPLGDRGQRLGAGQHRGDRHDQHRAERVPPAAALSWVGDPGEAVEQAADLVGRQHGGRSQPLGSRRNGRGCAGGHGGPDGS